MGEGGTGLIFCRNRNRNSREQKIDWRSRLGGKMEYGGTGPIFGPVYNRELRQNGFDKVRDKVRDKVSLSGGPA